ncbi:hypothetical protein N7533_006591 [Penicillium manginii]|uniref:uncharacterized protein n=1 Tax=Penicillium manginii TaxID=203109 RepID=UPI002549B243|nr:uncharacterized protein N7533_006591 [Penicillium manginii]KAJ5749563.1 hypothetical protein N7533_006591 [Penicillium manginii]
MSRPNPQQENQHQTGFSASRQREFFRYVVSREVYYYHHQDTTAQQSPDGARVCYRYLPPTHFQSSVLNHVGHDTKTTDIVARSSMDAVLTAFAQLGTLRLDAKHALISLFGHNEEHVLTEATRTLSLQNDAVHVDDDALWIGSCTVSYGRSLCKAVLNSSQFTENPTQSFVVPDLAKDEDLSGHQDVVGFPNFRFLACSPIVSPKGFVIGAYTVLDDKPHEPLSATLTAFMADISHTVMDYLVATRAKYQHTRSERMMVGLGSFLEGKGSLRNTWISAHEDITSFPKEEHLEGHVNREQQEMQTLDTVANGLSAGNSTQLLPHRRKNFNISGNQKVTAQMDQGQSSLDPEHKSQYHFHERPRRERGHRAKTGRKRSGNRSPKADYVTQVQGTFSRAANIIRESIEVEATVFFDAHFASQDALVNMSADDSGSSSVGGFSSSDEGGSIGISSPNESLPSMENDEKAGPSAVSPCKILGFATSDLSSISNESMGDRKISLSEKFLGHLLRRYPQGKIFNYGEDGSISSDDTSDHIVTPLDQRIGGLRYKRTRMTILRQDAVTLLQLAPNARSIIFSPLWDSHKERWYSGCLSWTKTAHRVLTSDDELAFLFAFGNSVMAEVHRLGALLAERAKSNLLAGISHELRSPLHGIFGTIDILNDTPMNALQRGLMHTISSCAFTLLGSIDQLLEYASINDVRPNPRGKDPTKPLPGQDLRRNSIDQNSIVQLDAAVEDAIETVFAGYHSMRKRESASSNSAHAPLDIYTRVRVVLDIESTQNLRFLTRPGAWHVILTNIFGNAMKFTQTGLITVSLKAGPVAISHDGQVNSSTITLGIEDSGCGMDKDFLGNKVFSAFSQEDTMSAGNGLGLNIVRRIVSSLNGVIRITSQKGLGTHVVITNFPEHIKDLVHGKTIGILVPGSSEGDMALGPSLMKLCQEWFSMKAVFIDSLHTKPVHCDILISLHESLDIGNHEILPSVSTPREQYPSPVIIICSSPSTAHTMFLASQERKYTGILEFISQPCGPRKLAKALETCIQRQQHRKQEPNTFETSFSQALCADSAEKPMGNAMSQPVLTHTELGPLTPEVLERSSLLTCSHCNIRGHLPPLHEYSSQETENGSSTSILLVDDNDINIRLLVAFMQKLKFDYLIARNGQEALDSFKENTHKIRVILMDISMPVMDGIEATRRIREHEQTLQSQERVMIVALTGVAQADVERDAIGSGMDTFLTKPVRLDVLGPMISRRIHEAHLI